MADLRCSTCGAKFEGRSNRKYCSKPCSSKAFNQRRDGASIAQGLALSAQVAHCPECGGDFSPSVPRSCGGYAKRKYCSERCRVNASARRRRATPAGQAYYKSRVEAGLYAEASRKMRARRRVVEAMECIYCGVGFERTKGTSKVLCGKRECKLAFQLDSCHRRNARLREATVEKFTRAEVFERDGWTCGVCGGGVDPGAPARSPWSASLDHIIPLAKGGAHSRENTQCAHLVCNIRKSDSLPIGVEEVPHVEGASAVRDGRGGSEASAEPGEVWAAV